MEADMERNRVGGIRLQQEDPLANENTRLDSIFLDDVWKN